MKFKKSILALGSLAAIAAPVAAVVSCGVTADTKTYDLKDTTDAGKAFKALTAKLLAGNTTINDTVGNTAVAIVAKSDAVSVTPFGSSTEVKFDGNSEMSTAVTLKTGMVQKVLGIQDNIFVASYEATNGKTGDDEKTVTVQLGFVSTDSSFKIVQILPTETKTLYSTSKPGTESLIEDVKAYTKAKTDAVETDVKTVQALKDAKDTLVAIAGAQAEVVTTNVEKAIATLATAQKTFDNSKKTTADQKTLDVAKAALVTATNAEIKKITDQAKIINDAYKALVAIVK